MPYATNKIRIGTRLNRFFIFLCTVFPTVFFCSTRMSFGDRIPLRIHMIISSIGFLLYLVAFRKKRIKFTLIDLNAFIIIVIVWIWKNWDLKNGIVFSAFLFTILFGLFVFLSKDDKWVSYTFDFLKFMGLFYAAWTLVTWLIPQIYYNIALPLVKDSSIYDLAHQYGRGRMPGLTAHYSTNGLYLATGICFALGYHFFGGKHFKDAKWNGWILLISEIIALLLTGKRGPVLYLIISFTAVYIIYNSDKPISRFLRIVGIAAAAIIVFLILASRIPELWNFIIRFQEESSAGDISNGRYVLWGQAYSEFLRNPIIGNGWYWFRYNNLFGEIYYHVHNCFLQWLCELGIIGSIPFFTFYIIMFYRTNMVLRYSRKGKIHITKEEEKYASIPLLYNFYFLFACFTGTAFFEAQSLCPYVICCAYTQRLWMKYVEKAKQRATLVPFNIFSYNGFPDNSMRKKKKTL